MGSTNAAATDPSYRRVPLARGADGEPFMVGGDAYAWRVRRFRNPGRPGACELVYGDDAAPLEIAIETPIAEFREAVGNRAGRYRLDGVDADGVAVAKLPPAYLQIDASDLRPTPSAPAAPADPMVEMMREMMQTTKELARENAALARAVIDRFPAMMDSAAGLLRAADGAGLPQRTAAEPRNVGAVVVANDNQGDEDDDEADGWPATIKSVVDQLVPMVQMVIAHRMGNVAPRNAHAGAASTIPAAPAPSTTPAASAPTAPQAAPARPTEAPAPVPRSIAPTADQLAHFAAIQVALTPREGQIARALVAELRPDEVAAWLRELCALAVPDAVALIRRHLAQTAPRVTVRAPDVACEAPAAVARVPDADPAAR